MKIVIESIPSAEHRYDTWGDWWYDADGTLQIRVSSDEPDLPTENHQFLVALHELVEVWLCKQRGVTQEQVDEFDMVTAPTLGIGEDEEPGDHPLAPYRKEHRFAMMIEHMMAHELGLAGYGTIC
jgi:hypothetical protein